MSRPSLKGGSETLTCKYRADARLGERHLNGRESIMKKPKRMKKPSRAEKKLAAVRAKHLPASMQAIAFSLASNRIRERGTFGPASPVRRIDPAEYRLNEGGAK